MADCYGRDRSSRGAERKTWSGRRLVVLSVRANPTLPRKGLHTGDLGSLAPESSYVYVIKGVIASSWPRSNGISAAWNRGMDQGSLDDKIRVLVVEDDPAQRDGIAELLRTWGYAVETASEGREALAKVPSFDPELVISDLRMSPMSGIDLLREFRSELRPLSCIVITGEASLSEEIEAIRLGAFSLLEKPIYPERLKSEVRNCLASQHHHSASFSSQGAPA